MTREEELEIINRIVSGERELFEKLVMEHKNNVYNLALRMVGSDQDALDISQEVFIKAYTHLSSFRGESKFSVWLYRLTNNSCIDHLRRQPKVNIQSLTDFESEEAGAELNIPDSRYSPEKVYDHTQLKADIQAGLMSLSEEYRQILILREINGLSYAEIAQTLDLKEGSVKSRLARARFALAEYLSENWNNSSGKASNKAEGGGSNA